MRPRPRPFLRAKWIHLAMLNYEVDPTILADLVPLGTELDDWEGRTLVSLVGFRFVGARFLGLPVPFHQNFEEVNLRFYVRRRTAVRVRRGVVFIKEIVARRAVARLASLRYNENFVVLPMRHGNDQLDAIDPSARYEWRVHERWNHLAVRGSGSAALPDARSEEAYIAEHYWAYSRQRDGSTVEYQVEHPPWRVWPAADARLDCDVESLYGPEFVQPLAQPPSSAFIADGSEVAVLAGRTVKVE